MNNNHANLWPVKLLVMKVSLFNRLLFLSLLVLVQANGNTSAQTNENPRPPTIEEMEAWRADSRFTTPAYRQEKLTLLIAEANRVAQALHLEEPMPITVSNVVGAMLDPPGVPAFGGLTTRNYVYIMPKQFSGINRMNLGETMAEVRTKYLWEMSRNNTNVALKEATQIMKSVGMDADALNRDCTVDVDAVMPDGKHGRHFVPDYWVHWRLLGKVIAYLEFVEPTKSVRQLHVYDTKYNLREPLVITNLRELMIEGNAPKSLLKRLGLEDTNTPAITNAPK